MTEPPFRERNLESVRPFLFVWLIYFVLVLFGAKFLLLPSGLAERMDFRQLYAAGYQLRTDPVNLYDYEHQKAVQDAQVSKVEGLLPFIRPAYEALLFAPLSYLPYRTAYFSFLCINLLLLLICFFVCRSELSHPGTFAQPRPGLQIFVFYPVIVAILQGQDSILLLVGFCVAYRFLKCERMAMAGIALGLMMFKLQIAIPLAGFLLVRYASAAFLSGLAAGTGIAGALSICVTGWSALSSFGSVLKLTTAATLAPNSSAVLAVAPLAMPNLKGLISGITLNRLPGTEIFAITIALSLAITLGIIRKLLATRPALEVSFSMALTAALLLSYYLHVQDLAVLLLPLGLMAGERHRIFTVASQLLYIAPIFVVMIGHVFIFLLSLLVILLLFGIIQRAGSRSSMKSAASSRDVNT
jgi:hypothetical protein